MGFSISNELNIYVYTTASMFRAQNEILRSGRSIIVTKITYELYRLNILRIILLKNSNKGKVIYHILYMSKAVSYMANFRIH